MAIEGPLQELSLEDVLQLLEMTRKTGILRLRSEVLRDEAEVHLDQGAIVYAHRRRSTHRLGRQLLQAGKVTAGELEHALELQRGDPGQRLGEVLLEMGSVDRESLEEQLRFQFEETVYDLIGWSEGHFHFEDRDEVPQVSVMVAVRVEGLLMEGARRIDEWTRLEAKVPSADAIPALAPTAAQDDAAPLDLHPDEWEVLAEIDGERDLGQIAAAVGRSTFDVAKIVYGLANAAVLEVHEEPRNLPESELDAAIRQVEGLIRSGDVDGALERSDALQVANPDRPDLVLLHASALKHKGRMRAATEAFARAVSLDPLSAEAHYRLGFAAARVGDFDRARQAWRMFLRLSAGADRADVARRALAALDALAASLEYEPDGVS